MKTALPQHPSRPAHQSVLTQGLSPLRPLLQPNAKSGVKGCHGGVRYGGSHTRSMSGSAWN
jgi:hypothetical protein